eukprot:CAMPEP_0183402516 /NCGR_PEP_ID=MMETSP0370-20130417/13952_1 /TAXON_ID=268820 /ORGANISM="Peridinium aciculiferum, Strain PAER-2" /LENGTH=192 /DNA_ID=CAMNT_0025584113 /DNA_START=446 /DNA_END=1024 /DNA_ORIENTATION=-
MPQRIRIHRQTRILSLWCGEAAHDQLTDLDPGLPSRHAVASAVQHVDQAVTADKNACGTTQGPTFSIVDDVPSHDHLCIAGASWLAHDAVVACICDVNCAIAVEPDTLWARQLVNSSSPAMAAHDQLAHDAVAAPASDPVILDLRNVQVAISGHIDASRCIQLAQGGTPRVAGHNSVLGEAIPSADAVPAGL